MKTRFYLCIGLATVFIAAFMIFFIFNSIDNAIKSCEEDPTFSLVCGQLNGLTLTIMVTLLIVGGFVIVITATTYIMVSAAS